MGTRRLPSTPFLSKPREEAALLLPLLYAVLHPRVDLRDGPGWAAVLARPPAPAKKNGARRLFNFRVPPAPPGHKWATRRALAPMIFNLLS